MRKVLPIMNTPVWFLILCLVIISIQSILLYFAHKKVTRLCQSNVYLKQLSEAFASFVNIVKLHSLSAWQSNNDVKKSARLLLAHVERIRFEKNNSHLELLKNDLLAISGQEAVKVTCSS